VLLITGGLAPAEGRVVAETGVEDRAGVCAAAVWPARCEDVAAAPVAEAGAPADAAWVGELGALVARALVAPGARAPGIRGAARSAGARISGKLAVGTESAGITTPSAGVSSTVLTVAAIIDRYGSAIAMTPIRPAQKRCRPLPRPPRPQSNRPAPERLKGERARVARPTANRPPAAEDPAYAGLPLAFIFRLDVLAP